ERTIGRRRIHSGSAVAQRTYTVLGWSPYCIGRIRQTVLAERSIPPTVPALRPFHANSPFPTPAMILFTPQRQAPDGRTLVDQAADAIEQAIQDRILRPGMALPSIRQFAHDHRLSTFTVMAAYNRLVA